MFIAVMPAALRGNYLWWVYGYMALIWSGLGTVLWASTNLAPFAFLTKWMWRQMADMQVVPRSMLSCQASQESIHWVHLEKAEMFSAGELEDMLYEGYNPAEECFQCLHSSLTEQRKQSPVKIHTVRSLRSRHNHGCVLTFLWSSWFHLCVTSSSTCVCIRTCLVTCGEFAVGFRSTLLFIFHDVCNLSWVCCTREYCAFVFDDTKHSRYCHLHFPDINNLEIKN